MVLVQTPDFKYHGYKDDFQIYISSLYSKFHIPQSTFTWHLSLHRIQSPNTFLLILMSVNGTLSLPAAQAKNLRDMFYFPFSNPSLSMHQKILVLTLKYISFSSSLHHLWFMVQISIISHLPTAMSCLLDSHTFISLQSVNHTVSLPCLNTSKDFQLHLEKNQAPYDCLKIPS